MNFDLTEDESLLKSVAERFVVDRYDGDQRSAYQDSSNGFSQDNWELLGELGILAAGLPEECGGLDLGPTALAAIMEALGRGLVAEPVIESALLGAGMLSRHASDGVKEDWCEALVSGTKRIAVGHAESQSRNGSLWVKTRALKNGVGTTLSGEKPYCIAGAGADAFLVSARESGDPTDQSGWGFYLVPADAQGLSITTWRMTDGSMAAKLVLDNVVVDPVLRLQGDGAEILQEAGLVASIGRSAEALGIMERLLEDTLAYVRQREQFGTPLGKFQVIQHRLAAQYANLEQARALLELAIVSHGNEDFAQAVDGARAFISEVSLELGHEAIQLHGGMGVTDELLIGTGHKRLLVLSRWPDDAQAALSRYAGIATV